MQTVPCCKWQRYLLNIFSKFHTHTKSQIAYCACHSEQSPTQESSGPFTAVQLILRNIVPGDIYQLRSSEIRMLAHSRCESKMSSISCVRGGWGFQILHLNLLSGCWEDQPYAKNIALEPLPRWNVRVCVMMQTLLPATGQLWEETLSS